MKKVAPKWIRGPGDEDAVRRGCWFDERKAEHVVDFFRKLVHVNGAQWAGKPFEPMKWQRDDILYPLFGWMRPGGYRRFRIAYIEIPKKQGKSETCAAIALYLLAGDGEPGAEVFTAAAARDQAAIVYRRAAAMAKACPMLRPVLKFNHSTHNIALPSTNSFLRAISADAGLQEGHDIHGCVIDELHAHPSRELWDALIKGGRARKQPLIVAITTAGVDRHSICYLQHTHAEQVIKGDIFDYEFFGYIRAAAKDDDWTSPAVWRKANPALGILFSEADMAADVERAKQMPSEENNVKRRLLNIWTEQVTRWISVEQWDACRQDIDLEALRNQPCIAALDLSSTKDLTALCLLFQTPHNCALFWFWAPEEQARERERRDRVPYMQWAADDVLELTPGNVVDYDYIRARLNTLKLLYDIREVAVDPWNAQQLATDLQKDGFNVIMFRQGYASMSGPAKEFEKRVLAETIHHDGNPIVRWMLGNVAIEQDSAGNIKPSKAKSTERIDGVVAAIMALGRETVTPAPSASVYSTEDYGL